MLFLLLNVSWSCDASKSFHCWTELNELFLTITNQCSPLAQCFTSFTLSCGRLWTEDSQYQLGCLLCSVLKCCVNGASTQWGGGGGGGRGVVRLIITCRRGMDWDWDRQSDRWGKVKVGGNPGFHHVEQLSDQPESLFVKPDVCRFYELKLWWESRFSLMNIAVMNVCVSPSVPLTVLVSTPPHRFSMNDHSQVSSASSLKCQCSVFSNLFMILLFSSHCIWYL